MSGLAFVLTERWDECEADFQRYYQLDLNDEAEDTSPRRLAALVDGLPPEAAIHRDGVWSLSVGGLVAISNAWARIHSRQWGAEDPPDLLALVDESPKPGANVAAMNKLLTGG